MVRRVTRWRLVPPKSTGWRLEFPTHVLFQIVIRLRTGEETNPEAGVIMRSLSSLSIYSSIFKTRALGQYITSTTSLRKNNPPCPQTLEAGD